MTSELIDPALYEVSLMKITYQICVTRIQYCSVLLPITKAPKYLSTQIKEIIIKRWRKLFLKLSERVQNKTVREVKKKTGMEEK